MKRKNYCIVAVATMLLLSSSIFGSDYTQFGNLNYNYVTVTSSWTQLNTTATSHSFTKNSDDTTVEVHVNSRFTVGTISGANGVQFQIRIDGTTTPDFDNQGSILTSNTAEFLSMFAVFQNLSRTTHTVSIWAIAPSGSATLVLADPGGWGGKIIVKETEK